MRADAPDRRLCYFALLDALRQPGCPLCRAAAEATASWLRSLFHEQVTDAEIRIQLRAGGTFCARHTEQALRAGDALGGSIIYGDLARQALDAFPARWRPRCSLCDYEVGVVGAMGQTLLRHIANEEVRALFDESDGLCFAHLRALVTRRPDPRLGLLTALQKAKLESLARECDAFVAKAAYDNPDRATAREATAWKRVARTLGGGTGA